MMHWIYPNFLLLTMLVSNAVVAEPEKLTELESLVEIALEQNPQIDAIVAQVEALEYKSIQAGAWKDLKLTVAYQNVPVDSFALGQEPMSMFRIQLGQTIPFVGKISKRKGVIAHATNAKKWEYAEKKNQLRAAVSQVYYQLTLSRQLKKLTEDHVTLVEQLLDAVRIKYEVGRAPQQDLLRLEVLRDRLTDDLKDFERNDKRFTARLNEALHRSSMTPISTPSTLDANAPSIGAEEFKRQVSEHRPALKVMMSNVEKEKAAANLARYEGIPDPTLFAAYGIRLATPAGNAGTDLFTVGMSLPIPIFYGTRYGARAEEAMLRSRSISSKREALIDSISSGLEDSVATWERAVEKVETYSTKLVPAAHRTLDATFSSYQVDRANFLSLFEAELDLLNFERTIRIATVDALLAQTAIEMLVGKEL